MTSATPPLVKRRRLVPRTWRGWLGVAGLVVGVVLVTAWGFARATPGWYQPLDPQDDGVIDTADHAQKRLLDLHNVIGRVPLGEQRWSITQDEINSLLAIRFAPPLTADGGRQAPAKPAVVSGPVVVFTPGKVTVSARTTRSPVLGVGDPAGGVVSVVFSVGIVRGADGTDMGLVKLDGVWLGLLPVPRGLLEGRLRALMPMITAAVEEAIELQLNGRDTAKIMPYAEEVVRSVTEAKPFPLRHAIDKKQIVIRELRVAEGSFSTVLVPPAGTGAPRAAAAGPAAPAGGVK
jgi:hypothetical protein